MRPFLRALALLAALATATFAQVPEGGAYQDEPIQMNQLVMELFSNHEVQLNLRRAAGRKGYVVKQVTRSQTITTRATYTFHLAPPFSIMKPAVQPSPLSFSVQTSTDPQTYGQVVEAVSPLQSR